MLPRFPELTQDARAAGFIFIVFQALRLTFSTSSSCGALVANHVFRGSALLIASSSIL